jgi:hypothetical protein
MGRIVFDTVLKHTGTLDPKIVQLNNGTINVGEMLLSEEKKFPGLP